MNDLKRHDDAVVDFDKAIGLQPVYSEALYNKGKSLTALKRYDEAFAAYDRALVLKPDLAEAWFGRGNVFCDLKRYDEAFAAYDKALALKPDLLKPGLVAAMSSANSSATTKPLLPMTRRWRSSLIL